ncbi:MAG: Bax inhibitor-1/YccA family protein [Verrucomicrobiia bacterium]
MRSGNPVLNDRTFARHVDLTGEDRMTLMGTVHKTAFLLILLVATASATWKMVMTVNAEGQLVAAPGLYGYMIGGAIGGLIFALITAFKPKWAPVTAPIYAALQGLFIGAISAFAESRFPGIVLQAVGLTFGTLFALLGAYRSGLIKATENFKLGVCAATGGIMLIYMATFILGMFGVQIPFIHGSGLFGIGFSAFVVVIAALNLVLDFDFIENGADNGAPKYMEWVGAFGLMVTLVWLYIEILHLLMKLRSR